MPISPARAVCAHPQGFATAHYLLGPSQLEVCVNDQRIALVDVPAFNGLSAWCRIASDPAGAVAVSGQTLNDHPFYVLVSAGRAESVTLFAITTACPQATMVWQDGAFVMAVQDSGFTYREITWMGLDPIVTDPIPLPDCPHGSSLGLRQWSSGSLFFNYAPGTSTYLTETVDGVVYVYPTVAGDLFVGLAHEHTEGVEGADHAFRCGPEVLDPQVAWSDVLQTYRVCGWGPNQTSVDVTLPPFPPVPPVVTPPDPEPPIDPPVEPPQPPTGPIDPPPSLPEPPMPESLEERLTPVCFAVVNLPYTEAQQCAREAIAAVQTAAHRDPTEFEAQKFAVSRESGFFWEVGTQPPGDPNWREAYAAWVKARGAR